MKFAYVLAMAFLAATTGSYALGYTPLLVSALFLLISAITYVYYARDKAAAIAGQWRIPENTLHLLSLCGGWPGGLIARHHLRHKTQKTSFRVVFWFTVIMNVTAIAWLHSVNGNNLLRRGMFHIEKAALPHIQSAKAIAVIRRFTSYRERRF